MLQWMATIVLQHIPGAAFIEDCGRPVSAADRHLEHPLPVRVVEYSLDDPGRPQSEETRYRLITTILDPAAAPAPELAALYAQRWEI